jgi:hypothetical protein
MTKKKSEPKKVVVSKTTYKEPKGTNFASTVNKNFNPLVTGNKATKADDNAILYDLKAGRRKKRK